MDKFTVDYDKKTLSLQFEGETHELNLNDGDVGDFWHSIELKDGKMMDVNFYQEDKNETPTLSVYELKQDEVSRRFSTDTRNFVDVRKFEQIGNPDNYFGIQEACGSTETQKSCEHCDSTEGSNNSSGEFQCDNCGEWGMPPVYNDGKGYDVCKFGITNFDFKFSPTSIIITITLKRPGLLIGKGGKDIDALTKYLQEGEDRKIVVKLLQSRLWR